MNNLSSGKNTPLILSIVLAAALLFAIYYYLVLPKKDEASAMENNVSALDSEIATLQEQIALIESDGTDTTIDPFALRKKVPQNRAVAELLLNIEQLELVAGGRVQTIGFNNYDSLVSSSGLQDPNYKAPEEGADGSPSEDGTSTDGQATNTDATNAETQEQPTNADSAAATMPISTITPEQLPAELKMLTLSIAIETPDYASLLAFIKEIEGLERVVRVDMINYSLNGEEAVFSENFSKIVSATIQVTTFYYEGEE